MDQKKCDALKAELADEPEPIVPIERFFDGNDDAASIGCNLMDHPGMDVFRSTLVGLLSRPDVEAVYAQISELDPGEDSWPFTDTVLVVGNISTEDLQDFVSILEPDDAGRVEGGHPLPVLISSTHESPVSLLWWD
jgi:hypothetical protein